jgi:hypothetical protein
MQKRREHVEADPLRGDVRQQSARREPGAQEDIGDVEIQPGEGPAHHAEAGREEVGHRRDQHQQQDIGEQRQPRLAVGQLQRIGEEHESRAAPIRRPLW